MQLSTSSSVHESRVPEPPLLGPAPDLQHDRLGLLLLAARTLGDAARVRYRTRTFYFFVQPEAIHHILVANHRNYRKGPDHMYLKPVIGEGIITSEGSAHLGQRRMLQPAFHRTRIAAYADHMTTYTAEMMARWHDGAPLDLMEEMTRLTLRIIIKTLCGVDTESASDSVGQAMREALALFKSDRRTLLPNTRRATRELDDSIYPLIARHRAAGHDTGDLLSVLIDSYDQTEGDDSADRQIRDEIMTLFFAGHDTTAATLGWAWSLLARHPEVEANLHAEIDRVLGGRLPTVEDLPHLRYTTMIFAETMRFYPSVWSISRQAIADDEIAGYHVPAGSFVMVSPYVTHHDARFYNDPERFDPERFHPDRDIRKRLPRMAYLPFGGGTRQCMGEPFAWMEGALLLATIASRYRFDLDPARPVTPVSMITLRPRDGIQVTARRR